MSSTDTEKRRLGLEQEFFLVDEEGVISQKADLFLENCREIAENEQGYPKRFVQEFVKSVVEINTIPVHSCQELRSEYLKTLQVGLEAAKKTNLRLYPLSTYPLHITPVMRDHLDYHIQARTVGVERFKQAAKCTGTHLHLELPPGIINRRIGCSYKSSEADRAELLNIYNLVTSLDPAIISLSRACPFYDGRVSGLATRTIHYRGSQYHGWEGVYSKLQPVGGLMPYAESIEDVVEQLFKRYYTWLEAMERAGLERDLFSEIGREFLMAGWNPVRLNRLGTVELRGIDSNYPIISLALIEFVVAVANRVRSAGLTVKPHPDSKVFSCQGQTLYVPGFTALNRELFYGAVTEGVANVEIKAYLDSIFDWLGETGNVPESLTVLRTPDGEYHTTEAQLYEEFAPPTEELSWEAGLNVVRHCCDEFEKQVELLISEEEKAV